MKKADLIAAVLAVFAVTLFLAACSSSEAGNQTVSAGQISNIAINISGMTCTGCEETIVDGVTSLDGVQEAKADHIQGKAWVTYVDGMVDPEQLAAAIEDRGYQVIDFEAVPTDSSLVQLQ